MKNVFKFKTFRKNIIGLMCVMILASVLEYTRSIVPVTIEDIIINDIMLFAAEFLLCFIIDLVKEIKNANNINKEE